MFCSSSARTSLDGFLSGAHDSLLVVGIQPESGAIRDELMRMIAFEGAYFVAGNGATG